MLDKALALRETGDPGRLLVKSRHCRLGSASESLGQVASRAMEHRQLLSARSSLLDNIQWDDSAELSWAHNVKSTPQKTRFRDEKYARIWDTD